LPPRPSCWWRVARGLERITFDEPLPEKLKADALAKASALAEAVIATL